MNPSGSSESDLLQRVKQGDEEAFTTLYRRFQGTIYRYALQMSGSTAVAEEVTQEVFMSVIRRAVQFNPRVGSLGGYLVGIARNHLRRGQEHNARWVSLHAENDETPRNCQDTLVSSHDSFAELVNAREVESLRKAIRGMPEHYREVVILCDLEEMSYTEAAAALGCAVGTVRSRLHRAHVLLIERLRQLEQSAPLSSKLKPSRCLV